MNEYEEMPYAIIIDSGEYECPVCGDTDFYDNEESTVYCSTCGTTLRV